MKRNSRVKQRIAIATISLRIYIPVKAGSDMRDLFASLFNEMLSGLVAAFVIINDHHRRRVILLNAVKENNGHSFFNKRFEMIQGFCVKGK